MKKYGIIAGLSAMIVGAIACQSFAGQWFKDDGKWAYRDDEGNQIKEGWFTDTDGKVYNFNGGTVRSGEVKINDKMYYFNPSSGERMNGFQDGCYYNFAGVKQYGWVKVDNDWYYANKGNGKLIKDQVLTLDDSKYYFKQDGKMARSEWVNDGTMYAQANGALAESQWVDGNYLNATGKVSDNDTGKSATGKKKIPNKVLSEEEYEAYVSDSLSRYENEMATLSSKIQEYRDNYNEENVYGYDGDDDDYYEKHELEDWDIDSDYEMCRVATRRAVELASCQRASGNRPDGSDPINIFKENNVTDQTRWVESVGFGYDDASDCYADFDDDGTTTGLWQNVKISRAGVGVACDADGRMYYVVVYAYKED